MLYNLLSRAKSVTLPGFILGAVGLSACTGTGGGEAVTAVSSASYSAFTHKASNEIVVSNTGGGLVASSLAGGMMSIGDTAGEPKRAVASFPINDVGQEVGEAHVSLYFDSQGASDEVGNLGSMELCRISGVQNPVAADYSAAERGCVVIYTTQGQYAGLTQGAEVQVNVTDLVTDARRDGDQFFTFKLRFAQENGGGNNGFNFYGHFQSVVLDARIARLTGSSR